MAKKQQNIWEGESTPTEDSIKASSRTKEQQNEVLLRAFGSYEETSKCDPRGEEYCRHEDWNEQKAEDDDDDYDPTPEQTGGQSVCNPNCARIHSPKVTCEEAAAEVVARSLTPISGSEGYNHLRDLLQAAIAQIELSEQESRDEGFDGEEVPTLASMKELVQSALDKWDW